MESLKINRTGMTLVDQVEERLIEYFKEQNLRPGSSIPNEAELSESLGIGRTVLREALSRFKMTGMIESRTKRGMTLAEPSLLSSLKRCVNPLLMRPETLREIFEFRIALEVGTTKVLFSNVTPKDISDLEEIVNFEETRKAFFPSVTQCEFHQRLYQIVNNKTISEFQKAILPALDYVMQENRESFDQIESRLEEEGKLVTHRDLLQYIKNGDAAGYAQAISDHFLIYWEYLHESESL